ncbi:MAG: HNH endonuclease [Saprospiraceae bacterium]|nr:HNH endonuclease [Saprospiraceae bacterium]MCF8250689.1 HNH endonuclease [Saprospiraceae bacterium]MCF8282737.1 HNH endonuclease [Bacteroidales bacterium]MCF8312541.1 HNH endonuclease [Saprospiraceae bacterium]MCF8440779.1 HNH endonuclease [Saprospiraceae bacterium]
MSRYISAKNRNFVKERAAQTCEYCKVPELFSFIGYEIDHIISLKHGGENSLENLAWACAICSLNKGTDIGTMLLPSQKIIRFFNPRTEDWALHFEVSDALNLPKTEIGEATVKIFQFNQVDRLMERQMLANAGLYPPPDGLLAN